MATNAIAYSLPSSRNPEPVAHVWALQWSKDAVDWVIVGGPWTDEATADQEYAKASQAQPQHCWRKTRIDMLGEVVEQVLSQEVKERAAAELARVREELEARLSGNSVPLLPTGPAVTWGASVLRGEIRRIEPPPEQVAQQMVHEQQRQREIAWEEYRDRTIRAMDHVREPQVNEEIL